IRSNISDLPDVVHTRAGPRRTRKTPRPVADFAKSATGLGACPAFSPVPVLPGGASPGGSVLQAADQVVVLVPQGLRHAVAELLEVLGDERGLLLPHLGVDRQEGLQVGVVDVQALGV